MLQKELHPVNDIRTAGRSRGCKSFYSASPQSQVIALLGGRC